MKNKRDLCRLCLKKLSDTDFIEIEEITREILDVLLVIPINLDISEEHCICGNCVEHLKKSFDFKSACLYTEDFIAPFVASEGNNKVDLNDVYMKKENANLINIQENQMICRFCLTLLTDNEFVPLYEQEQEIISIQDLIHKYIPELDLAVTKKPVICAGCLKSLENYSGFVEKCVDTENTIKDYCKINRIDKEVQLTEVLYFALQQLFGSEVITTILSKTEERLGYIKKNDSTSITIKKEDIAQLEPVYFDGIDEYNEIKTEVEDGVAELDDEIEVNYCDFRSPIVLLEILKPSNIVNEKANKNRSRKIPSLKSVAKFKIYTCNICGYKTKYRISIINHELVHKDPSEIVWFQCQLCPRKFKRKEDRQKHMFAHKLPGQEIYSCENCSYKTNCKNYLSKHIVVHTDPSDIKWFYCHLCPHKTKRKGHLNKHILRHEKKAEKKIYKCEKCIFQTRLECVLRAHMVKHTDPSELKMYSCEVCSFKSKYGLSKHMRKHDNDPKQYKCKTCTFATKYEESLKRHMLVHKNKSDLPTYECAQCSYKSVHKARLSFHVLTHMDPSKLTIYKCSQCNYKSPVKADFNKHIKIHKDPSELLMYNCKLCPYKARSITYLNAHSIVHKDPSEVAMFECTVCGFKTKHKTYLAQHILIHDPSKRTAYSCNSCAFTSVNRSSFRRHIRMHKKNGNK